MNDLKKIGILFLLSVFMVSCGERSWDPTGKKYKLSNSYGDPFRFKSGGIVETWKDGGTTAAGTPRISCRTEGHWEMDGNVVVIEGLYNSNCSSMSDLNGRYKLIEGGYIHRVRE